MSTRKREGLTIDMGRVSFCGGRDGTEYLTRVEADFRRFGHVVQVKEGFGGGVIRLTGPSTERLEDIRAIALERGAPRNALTLVPLREG